MKSKNCKCPADPIAIVVKPLKAKGKQQKK